MLSTGNEQLITKNMTPNPYCLLICYNVNPHELDILLDLLLKQGKLCISPGGSCGDLCQKRAIHWHRGRRHGPVNFIPGRGRDCM